jgi:hypothetical protein
MFPHDRVIASLANYEIPFAESETTEALRDKLAAFYAQRSLTRAPIKPAGARSRSTHRAAQGLRPAQLGHPVRIDRGRPLDIV